MSYERCVACKYECTPWEWSEELDAHRCLDCVLADKNKYIHSKIKNNIIKELEDDEESYMAGFE